MLRQFWKCDLSRLGPDRSMKWSGTETIIIKEASTRSARRGIRYMAIGSLDFSIIRYSKVWEDHRTLSSALELTENDNVISITSAGDNTLNLLLAGPKKIVAIDLSPAQNAVLELKIAAIKNLAYDDYLLILGELEDAEKKRLSIYQTIRGSLPGYAQAYWDSHSNIIEDGIAWCGRLDKFFVTYHKDRLPTVVSPEAIDRFCAAQSLEEQREVLQQLPMNDIGELTKQYTSKENLAKHGRSEAQYKYLEHPADEVGALHWKQMCRVCQDVPVKDNFYLSWFLRGSRGFDPSVKPDYAPPYLTREGFNKLKGLVDRIEVFTGGLGDYLKHSEYTFSKANLSDIFEYMSQEDTDATFDMLVKSMTKSGRIAFWNQVCPRQPSAALSDKVKVLTGLSNELYKKDRVFYYCAFHVAETI